MDELLRSGGAPILRPQVVHDVVFTLERGRHCLLLTQRTVHLEQLTKLLWGKGFDPIVLRGGIDAKARADAMDRLSPQPDSAPLLVGATGEYAGEGFDCPRLDTLFLAVPVASKGRLVQYAGRILRPTPARSRPRSTTTTTPPPVSSHPRWPSAPLATPASASSTHVDRLTEGRLTSGFRCRRRASRGRSSRTLHAWH